MNPTTGLVIAGVLPALVVGVAGILGWGESAIMTIGGLGQIGGVLLVVWALSEAHSRFGSATFPRRVWRWLVSAIRPLLFWKERRVVSLAAHSAEHATASADARIIHSLNPNAPTDKRLNALEAAVGDLQDETGRLHAKIADVRGTALRRIADEADARIKAVSKLAEQVEGIAIGDTGLDLVGAAWFIQGIVFTTWSTLISRLFA